MKRLLSLKPASAEQYARVLQADDNSGEPQAKGEVIRCERRKSCNEVCLLAACASGGVHGETMVRSISMAGNQKVRSCAR